LVLYSFVILALAAQTSSVTAALELSARGLELLARGAPEEALAYLSRAELLLPDDFVVSRDLAAARLRSGDPRGALEAIDRALHLGDPDPEARELRAIILAELGETEAAVEAADSIGTMEADLIGAVLEDPQAAYRLVPLVDEESDRGALVSLVLAAHEGARGDVASARRLDAIAEGQALSSGSLSLIHASRELGGRLAEAGGVRYGLRLRAGLDHATNASYLAGGNPARTGAVRVAFAAEGALEIPIGRALFSGALRLDQHVFATERELYRGLDLTAITAATRVELAISRHPNSALVGFGLRYVDVFARLFRDHYATSIEGGPDLTLQVLAPLRIRLAFYGIATDFIDLSPANAIVSSVNRDRVGQRVALTMMLESDWLAGLVEAMFLHDDALGDAFDAIGGAGAARVSAQLGKGIALYTGIAVAVREYGPVGDRSIIGPASTRTEIRTTVELGARVPLYDHFDFVMEDVFINDDARAGHSYIENVLSVGVEATW
jgi:hypothetical protein